MRWIEAKVEAIIDQIPVRLRDRIAAELSIDLKVVGLTVKERRRPENRFARARIATDYVVRNFEVGTVDSPGPYFEGSLPMRWGIYPDHSWGPIVYFGGFTPRTIVGLGGSADHILGSSQSDAAGSTFKLPGSAIVSILALISNSDLGPEYPDSTKYADSENDQGLLEVQEFTTSMKGPREHLQFLGRRLLAGPSQHGAVLLGSPLYVARIIA